MYIHVCTWDKKTSNIPAQLGLRDVDQSQPHLQVYIIIYRNISSKYEKKHY